jgi:phytoene desaturase
MPPKKIAVVGGGPGGLTAAMLLAHRGFDVTVFEQRAEVGGRSGRIARGEYVFDIGSTLLMMKFVLDEMFELVGRSADEYLDFVRLDEMYRLDFGERAVSFYSDHEKSLREIERVFPGESSGFMPMLEREGRRFALLYSILQGSYPSLWSCAFNWNVLKGLSKFGLGRSMFDAMGDFFEDEQLKVALTFQAQYLGMSPWECPAGFSIVPYVEHAYSIYHVRGGINRIAFALRDVIEEEGGRVLTGTPVRRLLVKNGEVEGVELADGSKELADEVVVNADFGYAMSELVEPGVLRKYSSKNLEAKRLSSSTFMLYLGLDKRYEFPHHCFLFARDVRKNMDDLYSGRRLSDDPSIYLCSPSASDSTMAPDGCSGLYVLVPVVNLRGEVDWAREAGAFRDRVIEIIAARTPMKDLAAHIREEIVVTPRDWQRQLNVYQGAVFSLAHVIPQMLCFRPHNQFEELGRCYLVGGGTNPGSGMPTIYESGRIASDLISRKHGLQVDRQKPLPRPFCASVQGPRS